VGQLLTVCNVDQAGLDSSITLPSQSRPDNSSMVVTGTDVSAVAAASTTSRVSDDRRKPPPAVAAKPKQPSQRADDSKSAFIDGTTCRCHCRCQFDKIEKKLSTRCIFPCVIQCFFLNLGLLFDNKL